MDLDSMFNFSYLDIAKAIIDRFNDLLRLSERLFPFHDENTPLLFAVRRNTGNLNKIHKLLNKGEDINVVGEDGRNVLHEAVMNAYCSHALVKTVLQKEPSLINRTDRLKKTALHMAMMFDNNEDVVNELIHFGANVDARDAYQETPLHVAANFKHNLYIILLKHGADINPKNCYYRTPLHCALMRQPPNLNIPLIRALLCHGADVNAIDRGGNSILHYALRNTEVEIDVIRLLLECGACPNHLDQNKFPPLGYCVDKDIAELLIQYSVLSKFNQINKPKNEIVITDALLYVQFCRNVEDREKLNCFRDLCLLDIVQMTTDKISEKSTFYEYIIERYNKLKCDTEDVIADAVLFRYYKNTYPSCKDIILSSIKFVELLRKIRQTLIFTSPVSCKDNSTTVYLNSDCVEHIAKYLSKTDLMHFILAYLDYNSCISNSKNKKFTSFKRKLNSQKILYLVNKRLKVTVTDNYNYENGLPFLPEFKANA